MGMTLAEKILARASGRESVAPDEVVVARVDLAMSHENADLVRKSFLEIGRPKVWDAVEDRHHLRSPRPRRVRANRDHPPGRARVCRRAGNPALL